MWRICRQSHVRGVEDLWAESCKTWRRSAEESYKTCEGYVGRSSHVRRGDDLWAESCKAWGRSVGRSCKAWGRSVGRVM